MQTTVERSNKALEAALARIAHLPPPVMISDMVKVQGRVDGYDDYSDSVYIDSPYDDYQDK